MSYDDLLLLVEDNFIKLNAVQTDFKNLSIPPPTFATYEAFKPLLEMYEDYLRDFKLSLTSEKIQALNAIIAPTESDSLYTSSNVKFNKIEGDYTQFIKIFIELKNK